MMTTLTLEEAVSQLPDVFHRLGAGEEVLITEGERVVARLTGEEKSNWQRPKPGLGKEILTIVEDDDEHLQAGRNSRRSPPSAGRISRKDRRSTRPTANGN